MTDAQYADAQFPLAGTDRSAAFDRQPKRVTVVASRTTVLGVNVCAFECITGRGRGGSRPGAKKYLAEQVGGTPGKLQGLDFVVSMSVDALLGSDLTQVNYDEDNGFAWVDDPSTANGPRRPATPPGMVRRIRPGGSGAPYARRRPVPVFRLVITADDASKPTGTRYTWTGTEYTETGLQ